MTTRRVSTKTFLVTTHMNEITQCATTNWPCAKKSQKINAKNSDYDRLTHHSQQMREVAEMTKRCTPSHTDVIFVVMDALERIYEEDLMSTRSVTAMLWPYALSSNLVPASSISSVRPSIVYQSTRKHYNYNVLRTILSISQYLCDRCW